MILVHETTLIFIVEFSVIRYVFDVLVVQNPSNVMPTIILMLLNVL